MGIAEKLGFGKPAEQPAAAPQADHWSLVKRRFRHALNGAGWGGGLTLAGMGAIGLGAVVYAPIATGAIAAATAAFGGLPAAAAVAWGAGSLTAIGAGAGALIASTSGAAEKEEAVARRQAEMDAIRRAGAARHPPGARDVQAALRRSAQQKRQYGLDYGGPEDEDGGGPGTLPQGNPLGGKQKGQRAYG